MSLVAIIVHHERAQAAELAREVIAHLGAHGHQACLPDPDAAVVGRPDLAAGPLLETLTPDLAISIGGDGTMLRTVDLVARRGTPVIGVNVGLLGYLTEVEPVALHDAIDRFFAGRYDVEARMLLTVTVGDAPPVYALNEVVVEKIEAGHTVRVAVAIDDAPFTTYAADALIVATPTGSTAYALSARGPIVSPTHRALLVTPVSPHMLFDRTLVLGPDEVVTLTVEGHRPAVVAVDGRRIGEVEPGQTVRCAAAPESAKLVRFVRRDFHQILKAKFGLADR